MKQLLTAKYVAVCSCVLLLLAASIAAGRQPPDGQNVSKKQLEEAYAGHNNEIRRLLPPYSGPPLLLDISHVPFESGMCDPEQHVAWENHFNFVMGERHVADKGVHLPDITMTSYTTIDTFEPIYSLPAKDSDKVVIAKAIAGRVCIPQSRHYVYAKFALEVVKDYRNALNRGEQDGNRRNRSKSRPLSSEGPFSFRRDFWRPTS